MYGDLPVTFIALHEHFFIEHTLEYTYDLL